MSANLNRRDWLKKNSLAALGLGFSLSSLANEEGLLRNFGAKEGLINLGSNENPYGISPDARKAILDMMNQNNRYQFNVEPLLGFTKELAAHYKVSEKQVLVTAGSTEALKILARHFNKGSLVTAFPTFNTLPNTAKKIGTKVIEVPVNADKVHDLPAMLKQVSAETSLVYICNPANPTSTIIDNNSLKSFCMEASKKSVVVIDEAYIDFLENPEANSMIGLISNHPNIIIIRTFSKIHAMAGLRVGFIVGDPGLIAELEQNYFTSSQLAVSNLSMAAALASLKDEEHRRSSRLKNEAAKNYTTSSLAALNIKCIPSFTNFIYFPLGKYPGDFSASMLTKNILLRSYNSSPEKWARVSIGTMDEMKEFIKIMKSDWKA